MSVINPNNSAGNYLQESRWYKEWSGPRKLDTAFTLDRQNIECNTIQIIVDLESYMQWYSDKGTTTCSLENKEPWYTAFVDFHGIKYSHHCQFQAVSMKLLNTELEREAQVGPCELRWTNSNAPLLRHKCVEQMIFARYNIKESTWTSTKIVNCMHPKEWWSKL